jgi:8-oxo-dGTP diphosphatase
MLSLMASEADDRQHSRPIVTVDAVLLTIEHDALHVVLQRRDREPGLGRLALIGGYVRPDDADTEAALRRILKEKAGLEGLFFEQLMTFAGRSRDPRGWSLSIAHYAIAPRHLLSPVEKARGLELHPASAIPALPFDHNAIVATALRRLGGKSAYSSLPAMFLPAVFTLPELKRAYEIAMGEALNDSAFRRKITELKLVEEVTDQRRAASAWQKRPAQLYRLARPELTAFDRTL